MLVAGYWILVIRHLSLVNGHWLLFCGYWFLVLVYWSFVIDHWFLDLGSWLLYIGFQLYIKTGVLLFLSGSIGDEFFTE